MRWFQLKNIYSLLAITGLAILGYLGTLHSPFLYDDAHAIVQNPHIQNLAEFQEIVGIENILNRSFVLLTYAVNREIGGLDVLGYHLLNVLLHVLVGITLFFLTGELLRLEPLEARNRFENLPLLVSIIHVFNPMAVESVTYLSSRSGLLATLFFLLSFYFLVRFLKFRDLGRPIKINFHFLILIAGFFFLGCASKEIIVTMPIMGAVYLWLKSSQFKLRKNLFGLILILLPLFVYLTYRSLQMGNPFMVSADPSFYNMERMPYLFSQIGVIVFYYALKLFLPINLNFEPDVEMVSGFMDPICLTASGAIILVGLFLYNEKSRLVRFAVIWALITILPTSSFIPLKQLAIEHRTYLPGLGINLLIGILFLNRGQWIHVARPLVLCFIILMSLLTVSRGLDYRKEIVLWQDTAKKSPGKVLVHNNLANAFVEKKLYDEALKALDTALNLDPMFIPAYANQGNILFKKGRFEEAEAVFDRVIFFGAKDANAYHNAGVTRLQLNKPKEALPYFQKAVAIDPDSAKLHFVLANSYKGLKFYDQALKEYKLSLQYQPDNPDAHNNMGTIFWDLKMFQPAEVEFQKVLSIEADHAKAHQNLAAIYMLLGKFQKAVAHLERYIALVPEDANARKLRQIAEILTDAETP